MQLKVLWIAVAILTLTGCSYVKSTKRIDVEPFAESTINLVADINYGIDANRAAYLRPYVNGESVQEYRAHWDYFRPILRGIGVYSLALVTLQRSNLSEKQRCEQMADFMERLFAPALLTGRGRLALSSERLTQILADIRQQEKFLDALGAAQPIVDEVARFSGEYLDIIKASQDQTVAWLIEQIDDDYAAILAFNSLAKERQTAAYQSAALLGDYRHGRDPEALNKLVEFDRELAALVPDTSKATYEQLTSVENRIMTRLGKIQEMRNHIALDMGQYRNMTTELDKLVASANDNMRRTRVTVFIWSGAHRRLAAGITDPAKIDMMSIAKQALDASLPF